MKPQSGDLINCRDCGGLMLVSDRRDTLCGQCLRKQASPKRTGGNDPRKRGRGIRRRRY